MIFCDLFLEDRINNLSRDKQHDMIDKVTISVKQISHDYELMKHNGEDENLHDVGDEEIVVRKGLR